MFYLSPNKAKIKVVPILWFIQANMKQFGQVKNKDQSTVDNSAVSKSAKTQKLC